ncbi:unnamed protein product [Brassicogethes aeneus]|uniref:Uncharacterized protein n=1 Tax=Brassicogethes aeneus TaxID=1431903 RepID=A0A9P0ASE0_BRAAE|nr:unnamed protein product [Brassicogethes aeneus]
MLRFLFVPLYIVHFVYFVYYVHEPSAAAKDLLRPQVALRLYSPSKRAHKAINTQDGVKFFPISSDDYRGITKFLSENGEEYHTFMLKEEKTVQVVIRGLPLEIPISDVEQDLKDHKSFNQTIKLSIDKHGRY